MIHIKQKYSRSRTVGGLAVMLIVSFFSINSAVEEELMQKARQKFKPIPTQAPQLKDNPITAEKVELGKKLFFDPRLSASWMISCNSCHNLGMGGVDRLETSIGHGWQRGGRNSPTVLNAVFNLAQFWDGRAKDLMEQAKGPVQAAVEMNSNPDRAVKTLRTIPGYVTLFKAAFPVDANPVTFDNMARAIEAFEATLITPNSRFDQYLAGNEKALNAKEKNGLSIYMSKGCVSCHGGVNAGGEGYYPFGVVEQPGSEILPPDDKGRFAITRTATDEYVFKSPSLRNIELTAPFFHSGKVWDLKQAVAIMGSSQLGIKLNDSEVDDILAFLITLTGDMPKIDYPILPSHTAETPLPDNRSLTPLKGH